MKVSTDIFIKSLNLDDKKQLLTAEKNRVMFYMSAKEFPDYEQLLSKADSFLEEVNEMSRKGDRDYKKPFKQPVVVSMTIFPIKMDGSRT